MDTEFIDVTWTGNDGDGVGRLTVEAAANGFCGKSSAWFDRTQVEQFGRDLTRFPLEGVPPTLSGGFGRPDPQVHVEMKVYPVGARGQVAIGVSLASERWPTDRQDAQHSVRLELLTTYEQLGSFGRALEGITERNGGHGRIEGDRLA